LPLQFAPATPNEAAIRAKLAKIGVGPGKSFEFKELPLGHRLEIALGMRDGEAKVKEYLGEELFKANGWSVSDLWGDAAFIDGDWIKRAAGASAGIYGNDAAEAVYILGRNAANGEELDGSKHNYTLTFPKGELPPVNAFWSVTMYDGKKQLLIENPINRYLINTAMLSSMKKNADGSLTLYLQKDSRNGERVELAAGARRANLSGIADVLAENRGPVCPAGRQRHLAAAGDRGGEIAFATTLVGGADFPAAAAPVVADFIVCPLWVDAVDKGVESGAER